MQIALRAFRTPLMVTAAVLAAPLLPEPFGFWGALAALLLGPGSELAAMLFPRGHLSAPERLCVTLLGSITVVVGSLAGLNALAVPLTAPVVGGLVAGTSWVASLGALAVGRRPEPAAPAQGPDWVMFCAGAALALGCAFGLRALIS